MDIIKLHQGMPNYPDRLMSFLEERAPSCVKACGNLDILWRMDKSGSAFVLGLFCSVHCPGSLLEQVHEFTSVLRETGAIVISGFHSPLEKECLKRILAGSYPVIVCLARGIEGLRLPSDWREAMRQERLLLLSCFEEKRRRVTVEAARVRNDLVAALADEVLIAYSSPGSKTEQFCCKLIRWGKPVWTFNHSENSALIGLGARALGKDIPRRWAEKLEKFKVPSSKFKV